MKSLHALAAITVCLAGCALDSGGTATAQTASAGQLQVRRVWAGAAPNLYAASPSPDGTLLSEIDWATGDLAVRDLTDGTLRRVTRKGTWSDSTDYAEHSVFSPDGGRLAYSWYSERGRGYQLRVIGVDGEGTRVLIPSDPQVQYIAAEDWSGDGRLILASVFRRDRTTQLVTVSAEDGSVRVLRTSDMRYPFVAAFSPDSRWVAFDLHPDRDATARDIYVMPASGGRETRLVGGPANDVLLGWVEGGIAFYSDRQHTKGIWRQAVQDGRPAGDAELLRPDVWQLYPLGFARDAYYYGVNTELPQVHTALLDLGRNALLTAPAAVQEAGAGSSSFGAWSADGRYLAYLATSRAEPGSFVVIRPVDGADRRQIRLELTQPSNLQWSADGRSVWLFGSHRQGPAGVYRVDVASGAHELVIEHTPNADVSNDLRRFRLSPDGRQIVFKRGVPSQETGMRRPLVLVAHELATGRERRLYESGHLTPGPVEFSPDGRFFATKGRDIDAARDHLLVGRTDGAGELRTVYETAGRFLQNRGGMPWAPDGQSLLVVEHDTRDGRSRLLRVPLDGGQPVVLLEMDSEVAGIQLENRLMDLRLSPDGRRVSFGSGFDRGEIWRIDNLR
jgi:Tol biopolymer transport system component